RVSPNVEGEFLTADDPRYKRTRVDPQAQLPAGLVQLLLPLCEIHHKALNLQRRKHAVYGVRAVRGRHAAHSHVGVADRFYLFQFMLSCNRVEAAKACVQLGYQLAGTHALRYLCEANKIRK